MHLGLGLVFMILAACASSRKDLRPDWITAPGGVGFAVGAASYEIFGELQARERAVMKALGVLALQKGATVDLESQVESRKVVNAGAVSESVSEQASVSIRAVVKGREIPLRAKIKAFWKDRQGRRVWVLISEEE